MEVISTQQGLDELIVKMYFLERKIEAFYDVLEFYITQYDPVTSAVYTKILPYIYNNVNVLHLKALVKCGFMGAEGKQCLLHNPYVIPPIAQPLPPIHDKQ